MSYEDKMLYSREELLVSLAKDAKAIFSSDTATPEEKENFLDRNQWYLEAGVEGKWSDDVKETDLMALVVLDDVPHEMIKEVLRLSREEHGGSYLWLADTYDTLPDYNPDNPGAEGTLALVDPNWRSPFVGSSVEAVAAFIRAAPKPPKPLCKRFFAALKKERFEQSKELLIYKILGAEDGKDDEVKLTSVPCPAYLVGFFFMRWDRYPMLWDDAIKEQGLWCGAGADWPDDCDLSIDLTALILLDDFPIETINRVLQANEAVDRSIWLADTYENLPDVRPTYRLQGISWPISSSWRSPFIGKSIEDAVNFIRNAPKPPKPLNKTWFAVMQRERFEKSGELLVRKILPVGGEPDLDENGQHGTKLYRRTGMSLMCKVHLDKQQNINEDSVKSEDGREVEVQMQKLGVGEDTCEFEVQMQSMEVGDLGDWVGSDDSKYWWLD